MNEGSDSAVFDVKTFYRLVVLYICLGQEQRSSQSVTYTSRCVCYYVSNQQQKILHILMHDSGLHAW